VRTLTVIEFLTLDGVMQGLGSPDEDRDGGFAHGGWGQPYAQGVHEKVAASGGLGGTTAYLFGRRTYEKMADFWPTQPDSNPMAAHLNATPKHVATSTLTHLDWAQAQVLDGPVETAVPALKAEGEGAIAVLGSGRLVQRLMELRLVDELQLFVHPLLLGTGKRLFGALPAPRRLELVEQDVTSQGTLVLRYRT
jgi:dihydrofolate reductase